MLTLIQDEALLAELCRLPQVHTSKGRRLPALSPGTKPQSFHGIPLIQSSFTSRTGHSVRGHGMTVGMNSEVFRVTSHIPRRGLTQSREWHVSNTTRCVAAI